MAARFSQTDKIEKKVKKIQPPSTAFTEIPFLHITGATTIVERTCTTPHGVFLPLAGVDFLV